MAIILDEDKKEKFMVLQTLPVVNDQDKTADTSKVFYEQNKALNNEDGKIYAFITGAGDELVDSDGIIYLVVAKEHIYGTIN